MEDEPNEPREDESPFEIRPVLSEMETEKDKEAEAEEEIELPKTPQEEQLGYNSMVWAEALFKRFIDAISGRGGVEAITGYADQIDFIDLLTPLRQRMKNNDMFFQTALSKCNKDLLKRPLLIREDESYDILGFACENCSKQLPNRKSYCGCGGRSRPLAVKVFRKLRAEGLRKITPETVLMDVAYDKLADAYCCHPETVVFTNDSLKPICEVEKGDSVLDHRGYFSGVLDVLKRPYSGNLVQIRTYHSNLPIKLTPNHPVLAVPAKRKGRCFGRSRCYKAIPRFLWEGRHAYWVPAGDLRVGDLVLFPRLARTRPNPVICLGSRQGASLLGKDWKCDGEKIWTQGSHSLVDAKLPLSKDLMRLFGYYLAEGCTGANTKQISFCFNITEIEYAEDVKNLVRETLKIEATEFKRGNWMYVFVNSSAYAKLFRRLFGTNARTKKIPRLLLESSASLQEELIKGYWRGDGCLTPYGFDFSTSSAVLASQIKLILTRLGFKAAYRQFSRKNGIGKNPNKCQLKYTVRVQCDADSVGRLSAMLGVPHSRLAFTYGVRPKQRFFLHKRFALVPIRSIASVFYEGDVWNLKVNDSHSYTLSNFVVHNCDAFNAFRLVTTKTAELFGWEDRFRIENPELLNYMDHYFLGRLPGESKIPREEKEVLQFLVRGNIVLIPLPMAFDLIRLGISVVKYGYMFEVLGCTGADLRYRELAATFGEAYDSVNKTIRKELYADREERKRTKTSVNKVVDGVYAPCMLMPRHFWENGTIANQVILEPVFKLPVHPKADDGSLQMLYAPIGKGKCVTHDTLIITSRGLEKIGHVVEEALQLDLQHSKVAGGVASFKNSLGLSVPSLSMDTLKTQWSTIGCFFKGYADRLIRVKTVSGRTLSATLDNTFVVWDGAEVKVVNGQSLKVGYGLPLAKKISLPVRSSIYTKEWMKLFGFYVAEGSIQSVTVNQKYPILSCHDLTEASEIKAVVEGLGYTASFRRKARTEHGNNDLRLSAKLVPILEQFGYKANYRGKGSGAERKRIPSFMFFESEDNIRVFLDYYFSGDGWLEHTKSLHSSSVSYFRKCSSKSKELIDGIVVLLMKLGIVPSVRSRTVRKGKYAGRTYWQCCYTVDDHNSQYSHKAHECLWVNGLLSSLLREAGLTKKDLGLALYATRNKKGFDVGEKHSLSVYTLRAIIEFVEKSLKDYPYPLRLRYLTDRKRLRSDFLAGKIAEPELSHESIRVIRQFDGLVILSMQSQVQLLVKNKNVANANALLSTLKRIVDGDVYFDLIESAEPLPANEPVYDLTIPNDSTFMLGNGLFIHNTFLLSSIVTYGVDIKHELVFNVLGDKSNSFMLSCLPLFGYNARTNALVKRLDEELGVQPHGIPTLNLTFLRKDEKVPNEKTTNPPTKYDRIIRIDDPHDFEVPFDLIMAEFKKIVKDFDYTKAVGIINVRNLDRVIRLGTKESENIDVQVAINILTKFDSWRKGDLTQSMRLLIDEMSYVAPSQVMLYAGDASRSGATISDFLKESRRDNCSIDGATQRPLEIITDIRDSSTNVFFRELPASKAKDKSQIDFILESILLYDPSVRPIVRDISNRGLLSKDHYWFWWNKQTRSINVIRPSPPTFCLQDPKKTSTQIIKMYEKDTGEQILIDSWDEVPTLTHAASDAHKEKVGAIPI